jgi:hypothetical protein
MFNISKIIELGLSFMHFIITICTNANESKKSHLIFGQTEYLHLLSMKYGLLVNNYKHDNVGYGYI